MKRILVGLLLVCLVLPAAAQRMEEVFIKMPADVIIQLEEAWRKDLVDLYKSGKTATLQNTMQGKSSLLKLTDDYLLLQSTERSTVEMKLLPLVNNTHIICMISTVSAPVADSRVLFFTTDWALLPSEGLYTPVTAGWFWEERADSASVAYPEAKSQLDMSLIKYSLHAESTSLTAEYTTPLYLDEVSRDKVMVWLKKEPKVYEWKLSRFE